MFQCSGSGIPNMVILLGGAAQQTHARGAAQQTRTGSGAKEYKQPKKLGSDPSCRYDVDGWNCIDVGPGDGPYSDSDCIDDLCGCDYGWDGGHCLPATGDGEYLDDKCTNKDCYPVGGDPQQRAAARSKYIVNQLGKAASDPDAVRRAYMVAQRLQGDLKRLRPVESD